MRRDGLDPSADGHRLETPSASRERRANARARSASAPSTDSSSSGRASNTTAGRLNRYAEPAEAARIVAGDREHAQMQPRGRLDANRLHASPTTELTRRVTYAIASRSRGPACLLHQHLQPAAARLRMSSAGQAGARARRGWRPRGPRRGARDRDRGTRVRSPGHDPAGTDPGARGPSSIASTSTSRHEQASSSTAPSTAAAGRVGGWGSPSADWLNSRMSSVRCTTAVGTARRFRSVRVPRNGLMTIRCSPHSTPIAAQLMLPSGLIVVTTVSRTGASCAERRQSVDAAMRTLTSGG